MPASSNTRTGCGRQHRICATQRRTARCAAARAAPDTQQTLPKVAFLEQELKGDPARHVHLEASTSGRRVVEEAGERSLSAYMALPASQYSVLDGNKVERLDDETFVVYVGALKFFNFEVEPILTLRVQPVAVGCNISMLACKLRGSPIIEAQNTKFSSRMTNEVRYQPSEGEDAITTDISVEVDLIVPRWFVLPLSTVRATGNAVMKAVLKTAVPKFLQQLEADYHAWAQGDDRREPTGDIL